jgi:hypothetical protein
MSSDLSSTEKARNMAEAMYSLGEYDMECVDCGKIEPVECPSCDVLYAIAIHLCNKCDNK